MGTYGADGDAQGFGRLLVVETGPHAQGQHFPLLASEPAQGGLDGTQVPSVVDASAGRGREALLHTWLRWACREQLSSAHATAGVVGVVRGDAQQPGQQGAAL